MNAPKPWYKSTTILFNALTILIAGATVFGFTINQELFEQVTNFLVVASPLVNLLLRFKISYLAIRHSEI
jgi:hypothetical protein